MFLSQCKLNCADNETAWHRSADAADASQGDNYEANSEPKSPYAAIRKRSIATVARELVAASTKWPSQHRRVKISKGLTVAQDERRGPSSNNAGKSQSRSEKTARQPEAVIDDLKVRLNALEGRLDMALKCYYLNVICNAVVVHKSILKMRVFEELETCIKSTMPLRYRPFSLVHQNGLFRLFELNNYISFYGLVKEICRSICRKEPGSDTFLSSLQDLTIPSLHI